MEAHTSGQQLHDHRGVMGPRALVSFKEEGAIGRPQAQRDPHEGEPAHRLPMGRGSAQLFNGSF